MGIVSKQASIAAFLSYAGIAIGFVNFTLLMANWFTPVQVGLREILISVSVFGSQIAHLGTYRSVVKFFPFFKSQDKYDNGLLRIGLIVPLIGFSVVSVLIIIFKAQIILFYEEKSPLFIEYFWFVFPLLFLILYNNIFESYLQARSKTSYSVFLKSVLTRLITTILLVLFYFKIIDFYWFIVFFIYSHAITIILFILHLNKRGEFSLKYNASYFSKRVRKLYYSYSKFSILSGISSLLVHRIDIIMLGSFIGLEATSIYAMALYLSVLIAIPGESITKITMPLLSHAWKQKKIDDIDQLYKKTSATQFVLCGIILVIMWGSINNFYQLQRPEYATGKWVFLILGIAKLINMLFGVNGQIISISKYYRFDTITAFFLGIITVITNVLFIPRWGIEGAAIATGLSIIGFNIVRFIFVWRKLGIQPFTYKTVLIFLILGLGFLVNEYIPFMGDIYLDTIFRSIILGLILVVPSLLLKVSDDLNIMIDKNLKRFIP